MTDNNKYNFFRKLQNKYRLVILNDGTFEERTSVRTTPLLIISIAFLISLIMIILIFVLLSFTPLKEYVPGKTDLETQKTLTEMSLRVDSLIVLLKGRDLYVDNLRTILNGGVPKNEITEVKIKNNDVKPDLSNTVNDSLFRITVEEKLNGDYISTSSDKGGVFFSPISGVFTEKYDQKKGHFGIDIICKENEFIRSIADGIVIINDWTKETGFVVGVQHNDGFLSLYKHNSKLLKEVGDVVKTGESISVVGNSGELTSGPHLHFELWRNGVSLNPENYILF